MPTSSSTHVGARVPTDLAARFTFAARRRGTTPSAALKALMAAYLDDTVSQSNALTPDANADIPQKTRMRVSLPVYLKTALDERALMDGFSASAWVGCMIQSILMDQPVMTDKEIVLLRHANRQLAAVGRNINQIARAMTRAALMEIPEDPMDPIKANDLRPELLDELQKSIARQRMAISQLVKARSRAWSKDED